MKRTTVHSRRRGLTLALPTILLGATIYVPNALAANGGTFLGAALMLGTGMAAVIDASNTEEDPQ